MPVYAVITPARDEDRTIRRTVESMIAQTRRPARWVIVNDGSTDGTRAIVEHYQAEQEWIHLINLDDRGFRHLGPGVVHAFNRGLQSLGDLAWDFIVTLDADLSFEPDYFEHMLERFQEDPTLGMASGKTFLLKNDRRVLEWCHDEHVRGPAKMYSRACFQAIGGLESVRGWDFIDETKAQMNGFETRSFFHQPIIHHRPIDARQPQVFRSRFDMGRLYHFLGYHWLYLLLRSARSTIQDYPRGIGGLLLFFGYLWATSTRASQYDPEFVRFVRRKQLRRFRLAYLMRFWHETSAARVHTSEEWRPMKVALVSSSGGHLFELFCLRAFWEKNDRFWVSFPTPDAQYLLRDENVVYWAAWPTNRSLKNLMKNALLACRLLWKEHPDVVLSTGAGVAVPFLWVGRILGMRTIYVESITRITELSLTGMMVYPVVNHFLVQWEELLDKRPRAEHHENVL